MSGNNSYTVKLADRVVQKDIPALPKTMKEIIGRAIRERLTTNPIALGKPLLYSLKGHYRLRVGDYRIVYRIEGQVVLIVSIRHRKDVYDYPI